jgi:amino acid transporter
VLIDFWIEPQQVSNAVWITICLIVTVTINLLGAGMSVKRSLAHSFD